MYTITAMMGQCEIQKTLEPKLVHYLLFRHGVIQLAMTERTEKEAGRTFFSKNVGERHNHSRAIATKTTILAHPINLKWVKIILYYRETLNN